MHRSKDKEFSKDMCVHFFGIGTNIIIMLSF